MNIHQLAADIGQTLTKFVHSLFPGLPAEAIRYGGAALLGAIALIMVFFALRLLRNGSNSRSSKRINIPRSLQREGAVVDLMYGPTDDTIPVRCVFTSVASGKITCEIIERLDVLNAPEGKEIIGVFAPMKTDQGKVNAFHAKVVQSDRSGRRTDRIILSAPREYFMIPRRKHTRKRVADQQFIRVKLWIANPHTANLSLEDATPHIGVNSFALDGPNQYANAVVNISNGGLGLSIQDNIIPETCATGAPVVINLFMFNFREKSFKPYWYSGQVRTMKEGRPGFTRMGIEFDGQGQANEETGSLHWEKF